MEYVRPSGFVQLKLQGLAAIVLPLMWLSARNRPRARMLTLQMAFVVLCGIGVFHANYFAAYVATRTMTGNVGIALGISWVLSIGPRSAKRQLVDGGDGLCGWFAITRRANPGGFLGDERRLARALCCAALRVLRLRTGRALRRPLRSVV